MYMNASSKALSTTSNDKKNSVSWYKKSKIFNNKIASKGFQNHDKDSL